MPRFEVKRYKGKKKDRVYPFVVIIIVGVIAFSWVTVWKKVSEYEKGSTAYLMNQMTEELAKDYPGELTYKRLKSTDDGLLYGIYCGDDLFANATLKKQDKQGMLGFDLYEKGEISGAKSLSFLALEGDDIAVGDKTLADLTVTKSGIALPALKDLSEHKTNKTCKVPEYNIYYEDGLFDIPTVKCNDCATIYIDTNYGTLLAHEMPDEIKDELSGFTRDFLIKYTDYVVFGKGFKDIKDDIFYTSPIYNIVQQFQNWDYYYDYVIKMHGFSFSDFVKYTDDIYSIRVRYHYTQTLGTKQTKENRPDINFFIYRNDDKWQIIEMQISEWQE